VGGPTELALGWNFAVPDWEQRLREGRSLIPDLPIDQMLGEKAVAIFNALRLPDVVGQPTMEEAAGDWFRDIVRTAFGSLNLATRERMVRKVFGLVPKKNSKTTGGAGIALTATLLNDRPNAELQLIGPTQEIASIAFDQAWGMIDADPEGYLQKRFLVRDHVKTIEDRLNGSELKIKTFDMKVATGSKPIFVLLDEIHLMAAVAYASRVYGQIEGNMLANPESLLIAISTQSDMPPAGIFRQELMYARGVRDGRITDRVRTLPILYEFPEAMQVDKTRPWADPANWPMVLPNLGRSITIERLKDDFAAAQTKGEEEIRRWASQHLNVEIGMGLHAARWRGADYWVDAVDRTITLETIKERCDVAVVGIDGGGLDDLFGLTVIGREIETRRWLSWSRAWVQSDVLKNRPEIAEKLRDLEKAGDLVIFDLVVQETDDGVDYIQDFAEAADIIADLNDSGLLPEAGAVGLDAAGVATLIDALVDRGVKGEQLAAIPQGYKLMGAILAGERKLKDRTWRPAAQDLMVWCVGNAKSEQRGNAILITKEAAGKAKIDPLMAGFNAVQLMSRNPESSRGNVNDYLESLR
jgi:phage terminase large subunit-like protein